MIYHKNQVYYLLKIKVNEALYHYRERQWGSWQLPLPMQNRYSFFSYLYFIPQSQNAPYSYILHWKDKNCVLLNNIFICSSKESRNLKDKIFYIHVCWFFHLPWMSLILYPQIKWLWTQSLKRGDGTIAGLINVYFNDEYLKYNIMNYLKFLLKTGYEHKWEWH